MQQLPVGSVSTIPAPDISITPSPVLSHFFSGLQLNLTCLIRLATPVEYEVSVSARWSKSGSALTSDGRVSAEEEAVEVEPHVYSSTLVFSSLDKTRGDDGNYTCTVTISAASSLLRPVTVAATQTVLVESKYCNM